MSGHSFARSSFAILAVFNLAGCSRESVAPEVALDGIEALTAKASQGVPGVYELTWFVANTELILSAHVEEAGSGAPAQSGTVTFQVCLLKGGPTLQMKPAPSAECVSGGTGNWTRLLRQTVNESGDAMMDFGIAPQFTIVGFRFQYSGDRTGIASGVSVPFDYVP
jgi:hypothetical protein